MWNDEGARGQKAGFAPSRKKFEEYCTEFEAVIR
jgi:hypothetical protein